jgi:photosynthetic reaction center cytochrome c subunit
MNLRMKLWRKMALAGGLLVASWFAGMSLTAPRAKAQTNKSPLAEEVFKNVQVLKGTTVDDFLGTMGIMSAAVGFDCSECHIGAGTDKVDWAADTQKKVMARKMVLMVAAINKDNFSGRQMVTCWSCHHGRDRPMTTPPMEVVYGTPSLEPDDVVAPTPGLPPPDQYIDKYIAAIGGAQKLAGVKSYVATGTSIGFGGFGGGGDVHIYAKFPDQRSTHIVFRDAPGRGDSVRSYNGKIGWMKTPLAVLNDYELTGGELDGAKLDAELGFPGQMKQVLTNLRTGLPSTISELPGPSSQTTTDSVGLGQDRVVNVVQGTGPRGLLVTMYFDDKSGLLLRTVRYSKTPIGRVPTQVDYSEYRDVNGIKMPFHLTFAWLDGRDALQLTDIKTNVPIDEAQFGRPVSSK